MPEKNRPIRVSAATWPVRSTARAELMAIMRSFLAITSGSFVNWLGRISTMGFFPTHS